LFLTTDSSVYDFTYNIAVPNINLSIKPLLSITSLRYAFEVGDESCRLTTHYRCNYDDTFYSGITGERELIFDHLLSLKSCRSVTTPTDSLVSVALNRPRRQISSTRRISFHGNSDDGE
jgi:hypothetical protein